MQNTIMFQHLFNKKIENHETNPNPISQNQKSKMTKSRHIIASGRGETQAPEQFFTVCKMILKTYNCDISHMQHELQRFNAIGAVINYMRNKTSWFVAYLSSFGSMLFLINPHAKSQFFVIIGKHYHGLCIFWTNYINIVIGVNDIVENW